MVVFRGIPNKRAEIVDNLRPLRESASQTIQSVLRYAISSSICTVLRLPKAGILPFPLAMIARSAESEGLGSCALSSPLSPGLASELELRMLWHAAQYSRKVCCPCRNACVVRDDCAAVLAFSVHRRLAASSIAPVCFLFTATPRRVERGACAGAFQLRRRWHCRRWDR